MTWRDGHNSQRYLLKKKAGYKQYTKNCIFVFNVCSVYVCLELSERISSKILTEMISVVETYMTVDSSRQIKFLAFFVIRVLKIKKAVISLKNNCTFLSSSTLEKLSP